MSPPRDDWDGRSLLPDTDLQLNRAMIGIESFWGESAASTPEDPSALKYEPFAGFRTTDGTVYIEYESGEVEFYDLGKDPYQLDNLAVGKRATDFPDEHARVEVLRNCHTTLCWAAEDAPMTQPIARET